MSSTRQALQRWLLPFLLILFLLEVILTPFAMSFTYASATTSPDHTLTYSKGRLSWGNNAAVDGNGVLNLELFKREYDGTVKADDKVVAPGTDGSSLVRLHNSVGGSVEYTAVLYEIKSDERLPVTATLSDSEDLMKDSEAKILPDTIEPTKILRTVSGSIGGNRMLDMSIDWQWLFDGDDELDTLLGSAEEPAEITLGLYVLVEDYNNYDVPSDDGDDVWLTYSQEKKKDSFIETYLTGKKGKIFKEVTKENAAQIIAGEAEWKQLAPSIRRAINKFLMKHNGMTYQEMLKLAKELLGIDGMIVLPEKGNPGTGAGNYPETFGALLGIGGLLFLLYLGDRQGKPEDDPCEL